MTEPTHSRQGIPYADPDTYELEGWPEDHPVAVALAGAYVPTFGECFIGGCDNTELDRRGPVVLRDGTEHQACIPHWEAIIAIVGHQMRLGRAADGHPLTPGGRDPRDPMNPWPRTEAGS